MAIGDRAERDEMPASARAHSREEGAHEGEWSHEIHLEGSTKVLGRRLVRRRDRERAGVVDDDVRRATDERSDLLRGALDLRRITDVAHHRLRAELARECRERLTAARDECEARAVRREPRARPRRRCRATRR